MGWRRHIGRRGPRRQRTNPDDIFVTLWRSLGHAPLTKEHAFAKSLRNERTGRPRMWRFDYADLPTKTAVEYEGGGETSRHRSIIGYTDDCTKYSAAAELGWAVLRYTPIHVSRDPVGVCQQVARVIATRRTM